MTDGERLVWATTYALVFDRSGDAVRAAHSAAFAVESLRSAGDQKLSTGALALSQLAARDFLDEIVSVP